MPSPHAQPLRIDVDDSDVIKTFLKFQKFMPPLMRQGLLESMDVVGFAAATTYMKVRAVLDSATGQTAPRKSAGEKLGIVSSRLVRSIQNKESEHGNEAIRNVQIIGKDLVAFMGSKVPYAAIHEYGGSAGRNRSVKIPARPYLNPALEKSETKIFQILKLKLDLTIKAAEGGF